MTQTRQDFEAEFDKGYNVRLKDLGDAIKSDPERAAIYKAMKDFEIANVVRYKKEIGDANYTQDGGAYADAAAREKTAKATHESQLRAYVDANYTGTDEAQKTAAIDAAFDKVKPTVDTVTDGISNAWERVKNPTKETAIDAVSAAAGGGFVYWLADLIGVENPFGKFILAVGGMVAGWMISEKLQGNPTTTTPSTNTTSPPPASTTEAGFMITAIDVAKHQATIEKQVGTETFVVVEQLDTANSKVVSLVSGMKKGDATEQFSATEKTDAAAFIDIPAGATVGQNLPIPNATATKLKGNLTNPDR